MPAGVVGLDATFPMSRYFAAFDIAVAAAGYNAFHELIAFGVPTLFVPMSRDTDDQGPGPAGPLTPASRLAVEERSDPALADQLRGLADPGRGGLGPAASVFPGNGAGDAARIDRHAVGRTAPPAVRDRGRSIAGSALEPPVGPTLPLVAALGARDLPATPSAAAVPRDPRPRHPG